MADVTEILIEASSRVTTRLQNALGKIRKSEYGPNEWLSDAVGFWVDDLAGAVLDERSSSPPSILLALGTGEPNKDSDEFPVPNPEKTQLTHLALVGGTNKIPRDPPTNTFLVLGKPSSPKPHTTKAGHVRITLHSLDTLSTPLAAGEQYVGLLYEDQKPLAQVIVLVK